MSNINFNAFEMRRGNILIEYPTKTSSGIVMINDNKTLQSGWFKVIKSGKFDNVQRSEEDIVADVDKGKEVFVYFHHQPIEFEEIIFKSFKEQQQYITKQTATSSIILSDGMGGLKEAKSTDDDGRVFALVPEHSILFTRDFVETKVKELTKEEIADLKEKEARPKLTNDVLREIRKSSDEQSN